MKISFQGFKWSTSCQAFTLKDFMTNLHAMNGEKIKHRIIYLVQNENTWNGLVLTIKDMKKFVTLTASQRNIVLNAHELNDDEHLADFNFFAIDERSGFGLYQHYHHSCSLNIFNTIARHAYYGIRNEKYKQKEEELKSKETVEREVKRELKKYSGRFKAAIIERKGAFIERVAGMQNAFTANLEFLGLDYVENKFSPIKPHLKSLNYRLSFEKEGSPLQKVASLSTVLRDPALKKATVEGLDENGNDVTYRLVNDFDRFRTYDYEDMVPSLNLDQEQVDKSILENKIVCELNLALDELLPPLLAAGA